jgi:hypothetical protein
VELAEMPLNWIAKTSPYDRSADENQAPSTPSFGENAETPTLLGKPLQ